MKLLHTSITVKDMGATIQFYTTHFDMKLLRRREIPENNAEIAFLGHGNYNHQIELAHWRGKKDYTEGDQLDHFAFEVQDMDEKMRSLRSAGVEIAKEPFMLTGGTQRIAFVKDPNGIWIELVEAK